MILKDLLFQVDREKLIDTLYERYFSSGHLSSLKKDVHDKFDYLLDELKDITPTEVDTGNILVAYKFQYEYEDEITIETSLYKLEDILNKFNRIKEFDDLTFDDVELLSDSQISEYLKFNQKMLVESYSYIADDVSNILGYTIDEISFNELGIYECLSNVLFELTYFGCDLIDREKNIESLNNPNIVDEEKELEHDKFDDMQFSTESLGDYLDDDIKNNSYNEDRINLFNILSEYKSLSKVYNKLKEENYQ